MEDAPTRLRGLPTWLVSQAAARSQRLVASRLAEAGLRKHHYSVMHALLESGPSSQADLGRRLGIDRSDLHAVVNDLEGAGLVERSRDAGDRRRNLVTLSATAPAELARLDALVDAAQAQLLAPLSAAERRTLADLLARLVDSSPRA